MDGPVLRKEIAMQNIHVKRYQNAPMGYAGTIEPEDRSWCLFVPSDGEPQLFVRRELKDSAGAVEHHFVPLGS